MDLTCMEMVSDSALQCLYTSTLSVPPTVDPVLAADVRVMGNMLEDEASSMALLHDYCSSGRQTELKPHMRKIVTDWMLEVCEDQEAGPEVFLLAVHYLDTFLSTTSIRKDQFQLVAATCLLLASKFSSVVPVSAVQLVLYTDHSITLEELVQWEVEALGVLGWDLSFPTSHSFLDQLVGRVRHLHLLSTHQVVRLQRHARTLATLAATEATFMTANSSLVAGAAIISAYRGLALPSSPSLVHRLSSTLSTSPHTLLHAATIMDSIVVGSRTSKSSSTPSTPSTSTTSCVSTKEGEGNRTPTDCHLVSV